MSKKYPKPSEYGLTWTNPREIAHLFKQANKKYNFGYSDKEVQDICSKLEQIPSQPDSLRPISLSVWPKGNFQDSWRKVRQWFLDSVKNRGIDMYNRCIADAYLVVTELSMAYPDETQDLAIIKIDIRNSRVEFRYKNEFNQKILLSGKLGREIFVFFALHPQALECMNEINLPHIKASGVKLQGCFVPEF